MAEEILDSNSAIIKRLIDCPPTRRCKRCREVLPLSHFNSDSSRPDGTHPYCRACLTAYQREYRNRNHDRLAPLRRRSNMRRKYGIAPDVFDALLMKQGSRCAICRCELDMGNHTCVDHCHSTGRIRGILCRKCNTGIGQFSDDPILLATALRYLMGDQVDESG